MPAVNYLQKNFPKAKRAALKALRLDANLAESHLALAMVKLFYDWNLEGARLSFERAIELNPGNAEVYHSYSLYLHLSGDYHNAELNILKSLELDPLSPPIINSLVSVYFSQRKYDKALVQCEKILELNPHFRNTLENKGLIYLFKGESEKAIELFKNLDHKKTGFCKELHS